MTYCEWIGYAKLADFAWVGIMLSSGLIAGIIAFWGSRAVIGTHFEKRLPTGSLIVASLCFTSAWLLALSDKYGSSAIAWSLAGGAAVLPWLDRQWYRPAREGSHDQVWPSRGHRYWLLPVCLVIGIVWAYDPYLHVLAFDAVHEGVHLLYLQHALAGESPGVAVRTEYGPLYTRSIIAWLRFTGITVEHQRRYFQVAQALGIALNLAVIGWTLSGISAIATTTVAMLGLTPASLAAFGYGWANCLRPGLALAGLTLCWLGLERASRFQLGAAGVLLALALLYSPEYGCAAIAGVIILCLLQQPARDTWSSVTVVVGMTIGLSVALWMLMFGRDSWRAASNLVQGYALARLGGHAARPWPNVLWWVSPVFVINHANAYLYEFSLWAPFVICSLAGIWLIGKNIRSTNGTARLVVALTATTFLFQLSAIARPLGSQSSSAPPAILLGGVLLDQLARRSRIGLMAVAALVMAFSFLNPHGNILCGLNRVFAHPNWSAGATISDVRLGDVHLGTEQTNFIKNTVQAVREHCPPGKRFFLAAPLDLALPFFADRCTLTPWVDPVLATTPQASAEMIAALDRERPSLVVVGDWLDIPLPVEHPELWAYIEAHYRLETKIADHLFYVRRAK